MKTVCSIIIASLLLTSCDCVQEVSGTVEDYNSGLPIEGAIVRKKESWQKDSTCEKGFFQVSAVAG